MKDNLDRFAPTNANAGTRTDGAETRANIIECAGRLIAQNGFAKTTSKSVCEAANVNMASINYYFGSRDGLYLAVMEEVLNYLIGMDDLQKIYESPQSPRHKLEAFLDLYINSVIKSDNWRVYLWVREMMNPSPLTHEILQKKALPKINIGQKLLAEYLGISNTDPMLHTYIISMMAPFVITVWQRHNVIQNIITPDIPVEQMTDAIKRYILSGLEAFRVK